jgi:hypothetical protein
MTLITFFILAGIAPADPIKTDRQTNERTVLSQESGRDPFLLPPGIHLLSKIGTASGRPGSQSSDIPSSSFRVTAILISDHARLALIDRQIVTVGDSIHGEKVVEIKRDGVILAKGEQKRTLLLSQSPVRLTVEQSPRPYLTPQKGERTLLEIPAAHQTPPEGPHSAAEQGGIISNGMKEEVKGENR